MDPPLNSKEELLPKNSLFRSAPSTGVLFGGPRLYANGQLQCNYLYSKPKVDENVKLSDDFVPPAQNQTRTPKEEQKLLGTLSGVIIPSLQNIIGVLLFIRLPWITGVAGIGYSLLIPTVCVFASLFAALSLSAIVSNGRIKKGGPYYVISRALGAPLGAAVGVLFALAQASGSAMYILGAVEILRDTTWPEGFHSVPPQLLGYGFLLLIFLIIYGGTQTIARIAPLFFIPVVISILSMEIGVLSINNEDKDWKLSSKTFKENFGPEWIDNWSFTATAALFFPSVTGMLAGSSRSAVLKDPTRSIPRGTLFVIIATYILYIITVLFFGLAIPRDDLINDRFIPSKVGWPHGSIIQIGVLLSTLAAALQSLVNAPRILQAVASDDILPIFSYLGFNQPGEPRKALIICTIISGLLISLGNLDLVAPIITIFFLECYASLNLGCFLFSVFRVPSWRPTFKLYHWSTAAIGFLHCLFLMFYLYWLAAIICALLTLCIYQYVQYKKVSRDWGDGLRGLRYETARHALLTLGDIQNIHIRNWRPQVMAVFLGPEPPLRLLDFIRQLKKSRGLAVLCSVIKNPEGYSSSEVGIYRQNVIHNIVTLMKERKIKGFVRAIIHDNPLDATFVAIQSVGLGAMTPNTTILEWPENCWDINDVNLRVEKKEKEQFFFNSLRSCIVSQRAVLCVRGLANFPKIETPIPSSTIDVWWLITDGGFMILLATLLRRHKVWRGCHIRLFAVAERLDNANKLRHELERYIKQLRIRAEVNVIRLIEENIRPDVIDKTIRFEKRLVFLQEMGFSHLRSPSEGTMMLDMEDIARRAHKERKARAEEESEQIITSTDDRARIEDIFQEVEIPKKDEKLVAIEKQRRDDLLILERMHTASQLNSNIKQHSGDSPIVFMNLPHFEIYPEHRHFLQYTEILTEGLKTVILVRGTEKEVVTVYT